MKIPSSHKVWSLLESTPILALSTVNDKAEPHCAIVVYDYSQDIHFFFTTDKNSSKAKNIEATKHVSFAIVNNEHDMTLQGFGSARQVEGKEKITRMKQLLEKSHTIIDHWSPIAKDKAEDLVVYEITPSRLHLLDINTTSDMFEGLLFEHLKR
jgi:general stress protein 26